jgi:translocation and assembly module TamB
VTGNPETPGIVFSSIPRLSKEEILSVILFDSEEAAGNNNGDEMMKMMGGAMAKSALSNVGIKIDHLALGTDGSMEIGKKITDKVTIIYVNDEVAGAKLQYDYSKNIKAVISTDSESSGADIIYKREFKKLPFTD